MKTLIFDVIGDYAHFRKYFSTSSPVTFSIIPPTAVLGIIGAIIGLSREDNYYLKVLNEAKTSIAIKINKPIKKTRLGINLINTKGNYWVPKQRREGARTQLKYEFIKDISYRLYVNIQDEKLFTKLVEMVKAHKSFYTVSLGLSELLADIKFIGVEEFNEKAMCDEFVEINSIVPVKAIKEDGIKLEGNFFLKERVPIAMDDNRVVNFYEELLIEMTGKPMELKVDKFWEGSSERIIFIV